MTLMFMLTRTFLVRMSLWAEALSCKNMIPGPCCWRVGNTCCCKISLMCWSAIRLPWIRFKVMRKVSAIPPHSRTFPHPNCAASWTHIGAYRSLHLLQTHAQPSCHHWSLNITLAHCLHIHWMCWFDHCKRDWMWKSWMLNRMMSMDHCIKEMPPRWCWHFSREIQGVWLQYCG